MGPFDRAAELIAAARRVVCLTGAGISTPSGIPDYRSSRTGVWETYDPAKVATIGYFRRDPGPFYAAYRELGRALLAARPNPAHLALVDLERLGRMEAVATQNIDGLHRAAGSGTVYELHGHLRTGRCLECRRPVAFYPRIATLVETGEVPRCEACGGVLKPDIVMFGEMLPTAVYEAAVNAARCSEVFLCAGSSLQVQPACLLPLAAIESGAALVIVNREPTVLDPEAEVVLLGDVADRLPALAAAVTRLCEVPGA